jgi:hypothetical protein
MFCTYEKSLDLSDGLDLNTSVFTAGELAGLDAGSGGLGARWKELQLLAPTYGHLLRTVLTETKVSFMANMSSMSLR